MADPVPVAITPQSVYRAGTEQAYSTSDETNGNKILLSGKEIIRIYNSGGSTRTITIACQGNNNRGQAMADVTKAMLTGEVWYFGPFVPIADWVDANGYLQLTYSAGTSTDLQISVLKLLDDNPVDETETA